MSSKTTCLSSKNTNAWRAVMSHEHLTTLFLIMIIVFFATFDVTHANPPHSFSQFLNFNSTHPWNFTPAPLHAKGQHRFLVAGALSFMAAAISSAGGIGGGGLFIPILTVVAGFDLKTASAYSAFMVTGGSIANVGSQFIGGKPLIDYDIALLSEPCMLLGVSIGVICNLMFPEWLITVIFAVFLAFCTFKTCKSGVLFWKLESEGGRRRNGGLVVESEEAAESTKMPLLGDAETTTGGEKKSGIPVLKLGMLVFIWFAFFLLYLLRGNRYGQAIIDIEACGTGYWITSSIQIPLAIIFTIWILRCKKSPKDTAAAQQEMEGESTSNSFNELFFPMVTLLAGVLGGVFGIGGGMLISPLLLQIGIKPEVTAATCSFVVLFSSTMSAIQYLLLGMENVYGAVTYAAVCFSASLVGLTLVQRAITKHGRASLIVFSVGTVMALSTVLITSFGAVNVWKDYNSGESMGFKTPC